MQVLLWVGGQQLGPYSLEDLHEMSRLGSLSADTLVRLVDETEWYPFDAFLAAHAVRGRSSQSQRPAAAQRGPSKWRGLGAALAAALVGGVVVAGITVLTGAFFTVLWWVIGWTTGLAARSGARQANQGVGLLAFLAALIGVSVSCAGLDAHEKTAFIFGGLVGLVSFVGSLWLAFRTGSNA